MHYNITKERNRSRAKCRWCGEYKKAGEAVLVYSFSRLFLCPEHVEPWRKRKDAHNEMMNR